MKYMNQQQNYAREQRNFRPQQTPAPASDQHGDKVRQMLPIKDQAWANQNGKVWSNTALDWAAPGQPAAPAGNGFSRQYAGGVGAQTTFKPMVWSDQGGGWAPATDAQLQGSLGKRWNGRDWE